MIIIKPSKRITIKFLQNLFVLLIFILATFVGVAYLSQTNFLKQQNKIEPSNLLDFISKQTILNGNKVFVPSNALKQVVKNGGWLQILNSEGKDIYNYNKPRKIQTHYAPGELVKYRNSPNSFEYKIYTWYRVINSQKLTWIYAIPYNKVTSYNIMNDYRIWLALIVLSILITIVVAFIFGLHMGKPILYMLSWIDNLSKGIYNEPRNQEEKHLSRSYRTYEEMITSIKSLSLTLKENDNKKRQLDEAREKWIAGISHDMKTPLSSVKGYADLISAKQYEFNQEQTMEYAKIISEKAAYMEDLIEDLNLTFRLSNNALPIQIEVQNMVELVRRSVIDLMNSGFCDNVNVDFKNSEEESILYTVDKIWFKRAIDNLLFNAVVHSNAIGTTINVQIRKMQDFYKFSSIEISIEDNGRGMDSQTLEHLFDRYYRGTSTKSSEVKSSGLGTAIAKQLIQAHNGTIFVKSELEKGTKFIIKLPEKN